jgi:hypothetical protein
MKTVNKLMKAAFDKPRDPRSDEYKAGVRAALTFRINGEHTANPHKPGTAQADAFFSGIDEGHSIYRELQYKPGNTN